MSQETPDRARVNPTQDQQHPQYGIPDRTTPGERGRDFPQYQIPSAVARPTVLAATSGTPIVEDEGVMLTVRAIINFIGSGVSAVDNPGAARTDITISGSPVFGTPAVVLGTAAAAGSVDEVIRRDSTIVAFDATVPTTEAFGDTAATGSAAVAARRDHKHGMPANPAPSFATPSIALAAASAAGVAATVIRSDATIAAFDATVPGTSAVGDAAAVGTAAFAARRDHRHGRESFATPAVVLGTAAAAGSTATPIRSDATIVAFDASSPAAEAFGDTAVVGVAAVAARRDHRHAMPATPQAYATVQDEGTPLTQRTTINFVGSAVAVTDVGGVTTVTVTGGSGGGMEPSVADWLSL